MLSIIKKIGVFLGSIAALASAACERQNVNSGNDQNNAAPLPEANGTPEAIYGMPSDFPKGDTDKPTEVIRAPEPAPLPEVDGKPEAIYGMPSDFPKGDTDKPTEIIRAPEPTPETGDMPKAIYGMPSDFQNADADKPAEALDEPEPMPSNEELGIMPLYGMPMDNPNHEAGIAPDSK